jgi:IclR family acetate operon transcriptional repressor
VIRALRILSTLAPEARGLSLQELADSLDIPVGSMHRILAVLDQEDFVTRSPSNRRYFLGPQARKLAAASTGMGHLAQPPSAIAEAAAESGETVFLTELIGSQAVCVALAEARHPLRLTVRIGQTLPLHAAAAARILLAYLDDSDVRRLLGKVPLEEFTPDTPTTLAAVQEHLTMARDRGYDICRNELDNNVWAVATPVRQSTGAVRASVTLAAPADRASTSSARTKLRKIVHAAADEMSADLGYDGKN